MLLRSGVRMSADVQMPLLVSHRIVDAFAANQSST